MTQSKLISYIDLKLSIKMQVFPTFSLKFNVLYGDATYAMHLINSSLLMDTKLNVFYTVNPLATNQRVGHSDLCHSTDTSNCISDSFKTQFLLVQWGFWCSLRDAGDDQSSWMSPFAKYNRMVFVKVTSFV